MTHAQDTSFSDLAAPLRNLWFVDTSALWPQKGGSRPESMVRKVLVHHHAGYPHDLTVKSKKNPAMPSKYVDDLIVDGYASKQYGYHYDIPFHEEFSPDGTKRVVYVTSAPERDHAHTGGGQNEIGIGISFVGTNRGMDEWPTTRDGFGKHKRPDEWITGKGMPSANQRAIAAVLVRWLQEKYKIADAHVQGHFQWAKPSCPGYDTERWVMELQDRPRKAGKGFCYPVALTKGATTPPFLLAPDKETRGAEYLRNTLAARSGFFPFGRRHFWHNGVHLFPEGGVGTSVHAVRDGWVVAARFDKTVKVKATGGTEVDYGSANFVIVQHEDPGLIDKNDARTTLDQVKANGVFHRAVSHPLYFSLYMHLGVLDEKIGWVKVLKEKDSALFTKIQGKPAETYTFTTKIALPVKTGEIIGTVGKHDPFAGRPANLKVAHPDIFDAKNQAVLHFEMFSGYNLIERFDPTKDLHKSWTIDDTDANAMSEAAASKLEKVKGLETIAPTLKDKIEKMESGDAANNVAPDKRHEDPSRWSAILDEPTLDALSKVVAHHVSEWGADWKSVIENRFREWGLAKGKADKDQKSAAEHALKVADGFKFKWTWPDFSYRKPALSDRPYFYHPVRLLNWLNGLERTLEHPDLPYNTTDATAFDISARKVAITNPKGAKEKETELFIDKAGATGSGDREIKELDLLKGSRFMIPPSKTRYTITATDEDKKTGRRIAFTPGLEKELKKGDKIHFGLYGWHWESKFAWDKKIL